MLTERIFAQTAFLRWSYSISSSPTIHPEGVYAPRFIGRRAADRHAHILMDIVYFCRLEPMSGHFFLFVSTSFSLSFTRKQIDEISE